ncbi:MAG TPA: MBL fold metallo-hydrolase [Microthrixaceae bacterium]|nr:MBL fold metallo-hydrolase [Microthrixaceae bacterium]
MREPLVPTLDRLPESVRRFELPTPFPVGPVNCYLLLDDPVTVVDPGMLYADSVATLTAELAKVGLDAADVGAVVVTHAHPDHYGTAGWLAERAGAPIYAGRAEVPKLLENRDRDQLYTLIRSFGIPEEMLGVFPAFYGAVREWLHDIDESRVIAVDDGEELRLGGRTLQALVTPGHAAGHLSLWEPVSSRLLSGDHLLPAITPNPLVELDGDSDLLRRRSLVEYLGSLDRFEALDPQVVLPGHGPAFTSVGALVTATRAHHERRAEEIHAHIARLVEPTAYELSRAVFPHIDGFEILLAISEVLGHVDLLVADGDVVIDLGSPTRYAST